MGSNPTSDIQKLSSSHLFIAFVQNEVNILKLFYLFISFSVAEQGSIIWPIITKSTKVPTHLDITIVVYVGL